MLPNNKKEMLYDTGLDLFIDFGNISKYESKIRVLSQSQSTRTTFLRYMTVLSAIERKKRYLGKEMTKELRVVHKIIMKYISDGLYNPVNFY
jgi:hypothetical protein